MTSRSEETSNKYFPEEFLFDLGEFEKSLNLLLKIMTFYGLGDGK